jgi:hypothetical protein
MIHFWRNQLAMNVKKARIQSEAVKYYSNILFTTNMKVRLSLKDMILL